MNQKEAKVIREAAYSALEEVVFEGFTFYGRVQEGVVFEKDGNFVVFKAITKKEGFADEVDLLMDEFQEKANKKKEK